MSKRVTIAKVATTAGVSPAVVSLVLNGKDNGRFLPETVERVRNVSAELNYRADRRARGLATGRTGLVSLVLPDVQNPFFGNLLQGVLHELGEDFQLVIVTSGEHGSVTTANVESAIDLGVDGLILAAADGFDVGEVPTVILEYPQPLSDHPHIHVDLESSARELGRHLITLGHRRIVYIESTSAPLPLRLRTQALREALHPHATMHELRAPVEQEATYALALDQAPAWLQDGHTAIVCATDIQALGVYSALFELGFKIPEDFSVVGGDGIRIAALVAPALTSVHLPAFELGQRSVQALRRLLSSEDSIVPTEVLPTNLVVRASTGPPRPTVADQTT